MVSHVRRLEGVEARYAKPNEPLPSNLQEALGELGISRLYSHQARGLDHVRDQRNVLLATPTASGKTLLFATSVLEQIQRSPGSRALIVYPTKALAQDQLTAFRRMTGALGALRPPRFEIYDGDTPQSTRRRMRADPPDVLLTNPDMLHYGLLAHHESWSEFLSRLTFIVFDELHVYRGIFGAHVHHIVRRLKRLARQYGATPRLIAASATVARPGEFAQTLLGEPFEVVTESGAPTAARTVMFVNPVTVSPYTTAVRVLGEVIDAGLKTIAFTRARRVTELLHSWVVRQNPELADRVAPYRAGYLPEERRALERRLFSGQLAAVFSTSALELGIDVGALDCCLLVGYPGSLISSWQRIGRVGRSGREGLVVQVAMPDALDQYMIRHPDRFFDGEFEEAVLDPHNPMIAGPHLVCAAAESPLQRHEVQDGSARTESMVAEMTRDGRLVQDAGGEQLFSPGRRPHRDVRPRGAAAPFTILDAESGKAIGSVDGARVYQECHAGAVYLHGGQSFHVERLDVDRHEVHARRRRVDYFTVVQGEKETEILEELETGRVGPFPVSLGRLKVTVRVRGYQKKRLFDGETISQHSLEAPPRIFETVGLWVALPTELPAAFTAEEHHFMGSIHATEHAAIGLFPLMAISDRGDIGGISYTGHPQLGRPAIFIYDGVPGGVGLAERAFHDLPRLLERTHGLIAACECEDGCPGCIQSPRCGNGNKPLDKSGALRVLELLTGQVAAERYGLDSAAIEAEQPEVQPYRAPAEEDAAGSRHGVRRSGNIDPVARVGGRTLIFDLETQRSAEEVGGWNRADRMGLALAVVYDVERSAFRTYHEHDIDALLLDLVMADRVVGFNIDRFDMLVLKGCTDRDLNRIRTFDMLADIHDRLHFRLSLAHLSEANLGESKGGDGLQSLVWWKEGRIDLIEQYCKKDVDLTHRLYRLGCEQGFLLYRNRDEQLLRLPVDWGRSGVEA